MTDFFEELDRAEEERDARDYEINQAYNKAIDDFQEWLKTQIVGIDNKSKEILVVVGDKWELAIDKFKEDINE